MQEENKSMIWIVIGVVLLLIVGLVAALLVFNNQAAQQTNTNNTTTPPTTNTPTTTPPPTTVASVKTFTLNEQNGSGQYGTAVLEETGGKVKVTIALTSPTTTKEPAHIHVGSCPTPGAVTFPLTDVVSGTSVTVIDTTFDKLKAMGALAINIHKSAAESGTYYACGNLSF